MVMTMNLPNEQIMSSTIKDAATTVDQHRQPTESTEEEINEDELSKGSSQTVIVKDQQPEHQAQIMPAESNRPAATVSTGESGSKTLYVGRLDAARDDDDADEKCHTAMIVSRSSSIDVEPKPMMDEDSVDDSLSPTDIKFGAACAQRDHTPQSSKLACSSDPLTRVDSLVAQMRDIVEGGSKAKMSDDKGQNDQRTQPKSSSDSVNNQNDSKASIVDGGAAQKRSRHSRGHCRHHHHHNHYRQRQSITCTSTQDPDPVSMVTTDSPSTVQGHYHHHHRHHRQHIHSHPHSHHHQHHHGHHHHHHHHHHHREHQQGERRGTNSKRSSIQRPSLALIDPRGGSLNLVTGTDVVEEGKGQDGGRDSNSSMSSTSSNGTRRPEKNCQHSNPIQSYPESKSSGTPPDENQPAEADLNRSQVTSSRHLGHHHHHHHRCHHRNHKRRLLDNTDESQAKVDQGTQQDSGLKREVLSDLKSDMNTAQCASQSEQQCEVHSKVTTKQHSHHTHTHLHHGHHHHHPHSHHHHHHIHCVASTQKLSENKDLEDQQKANKLNQHQHRHHKHHHHYHHHGHNCRHTRHKTRRKSESHSNIDVSNRGSGKQPSEIPSNASVQNSNSGLAENQSREVSSEETTKVTMDQEPLDGREFNVKDGKEESVVDMDMSPSKDRRNSRAHRSSNIFTADLMNDPEVVLKDDLISPNANNAKVTDAGSDSIHQSKQSSSIAPREGESSSRGAGSANQRSSQGAPYEFDGTLDAVEQNICKEDHSGIKEDKLLRQMSSQSSKKSHKDDIDRDAESHRHQITDTSPRHLQSTTIQQQPLVTQIIETSASADRRCRLCWCCCCPCSALSVKDVANRPDAVKIENELPNSPSTKYPSLSNVPLDEIRSWGESFDKLMRCQDGRKVFQDFLRCEYSEENILFWTACEELKKERDSKSVAAKARDIYEDYISILSSKEVSLDSRVRDIINNNIKKPTSNIFDEAQLQIYTLMHRDSYPRFINSVMYKKLARIPTNSSRKSSS